MFVSAIYIIMKGLFRDIFTVSDFLVYFLDVFGICVGYDWDISCADGSDKRAAVRLDDFVLVSVHVITSLFNLCVCGFSIHACARIATSNSLL